MFTSRPDSLQILGLPVLAIAYRIMLILAGDVRGSNWGTEYNILVWKLLIHKASFGSYMKYRRSGVEQATDDSQGNWEFLRGIFGL